MDVDGLSNEQWSRIEPFVPGGRQGRRGQARTIGALSTL